MEIISVIAICVAVISLVANFVLWSALDAAKEQLRASKNKPHVRLFADVDINPRGADNTLVFTQMFPDQGGMMEQVSLPLDIAERLGKIEKHLADRTTDSGE